MPRLSRALLALWVVGLIAGATFLYARRSSKEAAAPAHKAVEKPQTRTRSAPVRGDGDFLFPVPGIKRSDVLDTFFDRRGSERIHEATDIMAPRGTPVVAVVDGEIRKLFDSKAGGLTVYQFDTAELLCYYYAHLDRYAEGLREGMKVRQGDVVGYVGSTGNADPNAPHLHFAIFELGPEKQWWKGTPINPYPRLMAALR